MINLGIFGDQSSNPELIRMIKNIPEVAVAGVYFSGNVPVLNGFREFYSPVELMRLSDAVVITSDKNISSDLIKLILRKSKHIYLKAIPPLSLREIKELIDLEKEAGIVDFIYNPFDFIPYFDSLLKKNEKPVLINLRTCFEGNTLKPANELLLLLTALNKIVQSNYKNTEVVGLKDSFGQLVVNIRVEYENSSVANLTMTMEQTPGYCEIFSSSGRNKFEFDQPLYNAYPDINQEYSAICNFINSVHLHDKPVNSFDNLLDGIRILDKIYEHLRFSDIQF